MTSERQTSIQINSTVTKKAIGLAYDDHHKFYLIENMFELSEVEEEGYSIYELDELPQLWANSSSIRFLATYGTDSNGRRELIIPQCQNVTSFVINDTVYELSEYENSTKNNSYVL